MLSSLFLQLENNCRTGLLRSILTGICCIQSSASVYAGETHPNAHPLPEPEYNTQSFVLPPVDTSVLSQGAMAIATLSLKQVVFTGHSVFTDTQLQAIAAPFINKPSTINDIEQLQFLVTQHYIKNGYVNSGAILPEQDLRTGVLQIQIIEGHLTDIQISGLGWLQSDYIRHRLINDKVLNVNDLQERYLMLINDPLIEKLNGRLKPTDVLGVSQLDLDVTRAVPYGLSIQGNNYRAPSIGGEQFVANVWLRNLTSWGDTIDFSFFQSGGSTTYAGGMSLPLNSAGTVFDFHFELGSSAIIEEPLKNVDIDSEIENFSWTLAHPVYKSLDHTVILGTSFATRYSQTTLLGEDFPFVTGLETGRSRVSVVRVFQEYLGRFEHHVVALRSTFNIGIDAFGSTIQASNKLPDSEFLTWLGQLQYAYKILDNGAQIKVRGALQVSNEPLLSQERMSVGGIYTVRGYRENELVRDQGFSSSLEFHYPLIGQVGDTGHQLVIIPFMDYGNAWNKGKSAKHLYSVGLGLHWQPIKYIKADFYYGYAIFKAAKKDDYNIQDDGIHFNVSLSSF